jgi:hypothetical protein
LLIGLCTITPEALAIGEEAIRQTPNSDSAVLFTNLPAGKTSLHHGAVHVPRAISQIAVMVHAPI